MQNTPSVRLSDSARDRIEKYLDQYGGDGEKGGQPPSHFPEVKDVRIWRHHR